MSFSDILSRILGIGYLRNSPDGCVTQTRRYEHTDTNLDLVHYNTYFEQQGWTFSDPQRRVQNGGQRYND